MFLLICSPLGCLIEKKSSQEIKAMKFSPYFQQLSNKILLTPKAYVMSG